MDRDAAERSALDRPVWHALTGRQAALAIVGGDSRRLDPDYGPFAAAGADGGAGLASLAASGELYFLEQAPVVPPAGLAVVREAACLQMVATAIHAGGRTHAYVDLGPADATEMLALATLTVPGPFAPRTCELGGFIGIRRDGRLVAMAGERMKPGDFTEVSGVCTHPDHRGQGYAGFLMRTVAERILARGEQPFLHTYADNHGAIALYETLGFKGHQPITLTVMARA